MRLSFSLISFFPAYSYNTLKISGGGLALLSKSAWSQEKPVSTTVASVSLDLFKHYIGEKLEEKLLIYISLPGGNIFCVGPTSTAPLVRGCEGIAHAKALWKLIA